MALALSTGALLAQAVPESSQATRVEDAYRRTPTLRFDPFRHVVIPHWGFVISAGGEGENNALNFSDAGALLLLNKHDSLLIGDVMDAFSLVPPGEGVSGTARGASGLYLGGPIGHRLLLGLSANARAYGTFRVDDAAVALLRDGNGGRQEFSLGNTEAAGLATLEAGVHAVLRLGPVGSQDGARILVGVGGRYIRPAFYARGFSTVANGGRLAITGDSVAANIGIEADHTPVNNASDFVKSKGSGFAGDFLLRVEWPTNGLALEAMVANLGTVHVTGVERRTLDFNVATTRLDTVQNRLDSLDLVVKDTVAEDVTLPRIVRFGASAWANRILQLDLAATLPVTGVFTTPVAVDVGTTWRFVRTIPLRVGLVLGGHQGLGYSGGFAIEGRSMYLQLAGESLGGFFRHATGAAGRFELGFFF